MGHIHTKAVKLHSTVKKAAWIIIKKYYMHLVKDFHTNNHVYVEIAILPGMRFHDKLAGMLRHRQPHLHKFTAVSVKLLDPILGDTAASSGTLNDEDNTYESSKVRVWLSPWKGNCLLRAPEMLPRLKLKMSCIRIPSFPCSYDTTNKGFPARLDSASKTWMSTSWGLYCASGPCVARVRYELILDPCELSQGPTLDSQP
ncbi:40S ribosomal protein S17 [Lemmus lemmus]